MYLYLGGDTVVDTTAIVGLFDIDNTSWSTHTRNFLSAAEKAGRLKNAAEDIPKSFVLCTDNEVILAQPNTQILARRLKIQEKGNVRH